MCVPDQGVGDSNMAYQSFKLALVHDNNHAEALNNLGILEWKKGRGEVVRGGRGMWRMLSAVIRWSVWSCIE